MKDNPLSNIQAWLNHAGRKGSELRLRPTAQREECMQIQLISIGLMVFLYASKSDCYPITSCFKQTHASEGKLVT
jgi:hypothetical protein